MFIRWRTYQRQHKHRKHDKYIMQPILVEAFRVRKGQVWDMSKTAGVSREDFEEHWAKNRDEINYSRQRTVYRFQTFRACDYFYYDNPTHIENRLHYWEYLDYLLTEGPLAELDDTTRAKIVDEIESILPRPYGYLIDILQKAYEAGMSQAPSPAVYLRR